MSHIHIIHWLLDFLGVNNSYDVFSTKMYNFWSGIGPNFSILALSGTIVGVYRHNLTRLKAINPKTIVQKIEKDVENRQNRQQPPSSSDKTE